MVSAPTTSRSAGDSLQETGYHVLRGVFRRDAVDHMRSQVDSALDQASAEEAKSGCLRNLLEASPGLWAAINQSSLLSTLNGLMAGQVFLTRAILFDKTPQANWPVPWHQDVTIAVRARTDTPGFGPWSVKDGVHHVRPPASVLRQMLAARIHLDDTDQTNGALRVLPGSHREMLDHHQVEAARSAVAEVICSCRAGDVLIMRPMLLHASSRSTEPSRRRVIHLEFACDDLPGGLAWHRPIGT